MAKNENGYLVAVGFGRNVEQQNKPWDDWLMAKVPAAMGGLFAHFAYNYVVDNIFKSLVPKYGRDIVGSVGLTIIAYLIDHNRPFFFYKKGSSDEMTKAFTDGMMGRGAPAVTNAIYQILMKLTEFVSGQPSEAKKANAMMPESQAHSASLDSAPAAFADMMSLLSNSPKTRAMLTQDLLDKMDQAGIDIDPRARENIANCIGELATNYGTYKS